MLIWILRICQTVNCLFCNTNKFRKYNNFISHFKYKVDTSVSAFFMTRFFEIKCEILNWQMMLSGKETDMLYGRLKDDLIEETRRQAGILGLDPDFYEDFIRNSDAIINGDFKSAKFSDRIWANGYKMRGNLQSGIHNSMLLGDNPRTWARKLEENLSEEMDDTGKQNAFYNAFRLAVTESARVQINTGLNLMRKSGYEKYIWIAEPGACHICAPFNNHVFDIENSDIGDELPPMHPFCRCSIAAYYNIAEDEDSGYNIDEIEKTEHAEKRREERNVSDDDVSDALNEPLYVGDLEIDKNGRPSRKYVGKNATVVINPDTNKEITSWRTSSRLRKKIEKGGK